MNEIISINEFKECSTCASTNGQQKICQSCLHNKILIDKLKSCLKTFIESLILCARDGNSHIENELVKKSMKLCDMDERLIDFTEEGDEETS